jgi:hypothetical protein
MGSTSSATKEAGERARETAVAAMGSTSEATKEAGMKARETAVKAMGDTSGAAAEAAEKVREVFEKQAGMVSEETKQAINQLFLTLNINLDALANALNLLGGSFFASISSAASALASGLVEGLLSGALAQGMGMPFGQGVAIGEQSAKLAPEVVKRGSPAIRAGFESALRLVTGEVDKVARDLAAQMQKGASPVTPELAAQLAASTGAGATAAFVGLAAAASSIESFTLGQMEIPGHFLLQLGALYGLARMAGATVSVPYRWAIEIANNYFYAKTYQPMIPGPNDLVRFELREVWRKEFREELLTPRPTDRFIELMAYQGYSKDFAEDYWAAHWVMPGADQAYEMFHRLRPGKPGIKKAFTEEDLRALLKRIDILPAYHDQLIDIAYRPLTRVDIRRMYRLGILDRAGVVDAYLDLGYSPENAERMADFTELYEAGTEERQFGHTELINLYKEGFLDDEGFRSRATQLGYADPDITRYLTIAQMRYEYDFKMDQRALILELLRKGKITAAQAAAKLSEIMPSAERVSALIDRELAKLKA